MSLDVAQAVGDEMGGQPEEPGAGRTAHDPYAAAGTVGSEEGTETVYTLAGGDWDEIANALSSGEGLSPEDRIVVNMGPQHPSTHGVLRLVVETEGETVTEVRCGIGFLHTGIEKNLEFRNWTQGCTFVTRMDYTTPFYQEVAYCLAVEKLLGVEEQVPERANVIRVLLMELNRIASHMVCIATGGMEMGALSAMIFGFRERELVLDIFEMITGLRMNHAFVRPGGVAQDLPPGAVDKIREFLALMPERMKDIEALCNENPIFKGRTEGVGFLDLTGCMALGITGPVLRATGLPHDLRKTQPYCGYENYEFDVVTWDTSDSYGRYRIRMDEVRQSLRIVDRKIAWPAQLALGGDGMGNSLDHIRHIMGESMEALIHHFKLVTEGFHVPPGQVYVGIESPKGELGCHAVSDGGTRPYRVHFRDPSFNNLQAVSVMSEGGMIADLIVAVASIDPVMGGVDR